MKTKKKAKRRHPRSKLREEKAKALGQVATSASGRTDDVLDALPMDVLFAMSDILADPSEDAQQRARKRAQDVGLYLRSAATPGPQAPATQPQIPMKEAPAEHDGIELDFTHAKPAPIESVDLADGSAQDER